MPGPAPKPSALRRLQGNPSHRRLNDAEPQPQAGRVSCPRWLSPEAKQAWRALAPKLRRAGLFAEVDSMALEALCVTYARFRAGVDVLSSGGLSYRTDTGFERPRPEVGIVAEATKQIVAIAAQFGMTPSGRTRVRLTPEEAAADPFEEFIAKVPMPLGGWPEDEDDE